MRKKLRLLLILLWIVIIAIFIIAGLTSGWWSLTPIVAYNRPQGPFGWLFTITLVLSLIDFLYYHLISPNKK
ncbi:hypothetical protein [Companilactobacillus kimchiensis]|uniref:Integral membrane protein n=1 Tax=Companilactobacillus kimchiensis TaxID=993692 RepID=A0A0R2LL03_9LACO|nr:hypothetical protein [Companilactobacillus kimchiensis]KRN98836.1 hypothetical protein IV57_GL000748 [Companilactobacillus kimchiensis]